ncbi:Protein PXR1 [Hondaea fermentalgiana]|uniref:PinX1-related protein 1 n=1 Tax=Hondaea fermentalgiana TaxID=2315210 RepID=A0A2R5GL57_9STRA|nr:Protein PXR1 [Hondaea fermentalgiana]|eukprot:GBG31039.1 Protein PXR1 [Hondaea fermentalgiana]
MPGVKGMDTLNQRWANDKNKFGYKMMLKMGWSDGKGTGKNEDGRASHVKVEKRTETLGLGTEEDGVGNVAFQGQINNFNDVLRSLNQAHGPDAKQRKEERRKMRKQLKNAKAGATEQISSETKVLVRTEDLPEGGQVRDIGLVSIETTESGGVVKVSDAADSDEDSSASKKEKKTKSKKEKKNKTKKKRSRDDDSDGNDEEDETNKVASKKQKKEKSKKKKKKLSKADAAVSRKVAIRLVRAKDVSSYSRGDLNAIFGIAS